MISPQALALPINRCNVPGYLIASLSYQAAPCPLLLDGIEPHFADLFVHLRRQSDAAARAARFIDYMAVRFRLPGHELTPWPEAEPVPRPAANYRRLLLGWMFDSDSDAGAAWRCWVESRFGLRTLYHRQPIDGASDGPIDGDESPARWAFLQAATRMLYHTNALDTQLDLLYSFCQFELACRYPSQRHLTLYRGGSERPCATDSGPAILCVNNLSSFTREIDEAYRFGSRVYGVEVPLSKIVCFDTLLPGSLGGESEFMVLGGLYPVTPAL
ncbi:MAG: NAD(+)--dinitrogen-reductase ADP-D-ribosyltransferase [Aeromonadaceae bacterium]